MTIPTAEPGANGDYDQLLALAMRLFFPVQVSISIKEASQIYIGELPDPLPVKVPVPDASHIIGSLVRGNETIEIVLDVDLPASEVVQFYKAKLTAGGWYRPPSDLPMAGFTGHPGVEMATLCHGPLGPMLHIAAAPVGERASDVRVYLHLGERPQCGQEPSPRLPPSVIPALISPEGAWKSGGGGSRGNDQQSSSAILDTRMGLSEVMEHYDQQLERAGWEKLDTIHGRLTASSSWSFQDNDANDWAGLFIVSKVNPTSTSMSVHILTQRG